MKVISRVDDALVKGEGFDDTYTKYLKNLDESLLTFHQGKEPTRFILTKGLDYKASKSLRSEKVTIVDGKASPNMGFIMEEVRCSLVGIENPSDLPVDEHITWKKDSDGFTSRNLIAALEAAGIIDDLFLARNSQSIDTDDLKKD